MRYCPSTLNSKPRRMECESFTRTQSLIYLNLFRNPTIQNFVFLFLCRVTDSVAEILKGIRSYFDKALPVMLLYKKERRQYQESIVDDTSPSTVYGAEHLLRLFGKISLSSYLDSKIRCSEILFLLFLKICSQVARSFFICKHGRRNMESHATNIIRLPQVYI